MDFVKGSLIGIALGTVMTYTSYDKIDSMVRMSKRKIKNLKKKSIY